jgi:hypothetical protein
MPGTKRFALHRPGTSPRSSAVLIALGGILLMVTEVPAQRLPLPPDEQTAVNHAIDRGVSYLKRTQQKNGTWARTNGPFLNPGERLQHTKHPFGYAALPGLTLLECGVPPSDPVVQQAARLLRNKAAKLDATYELSLAILFLDRLGDPNDKKLIQTFALRLVAGQSATGGWSYKCPILGHKVQNELLMALRHLDPPGEDMPALVRRGRKNPPEEAPSARVRGVPMLEGNITRTAGPSLADSIRRSPGESPSLSEDISRGSPRETLPQEDALAGPPDRERDCLGLTFLDKNSLEDAESESEPPADPKQPRDKSDRKAGQDKPADAKAAQSKSSKPHVIPERLKRLPALQDPNRHILQDPASDLSAPRATVTDNSNTQFAILALWTAQRYDVPMKRSLDLIVRRYQTSQNVDGTWGYHYLFGGGENTRTLTMTCVGLIGLAVGHGLGQPRPAGQPVQDPRIINGLIALGNTIGQPTEQLGRLPMQNLYYLWSLERVAVLYSLPTIGNKDWYRWGAQILVRNQEIEGNWANGLYIGTSPPLDTCLALLFLKRANLVKDLTAKLPFTGDDLNKSIREIREPPQPAEPVKKPAKPIPPAEPPKPAELEKTIAAAPTQTPLEEPAPMIENSGGKKKWIIVSLVVFLLFTGGSLFFLFSARRRDEGEVKEEKPKKRTNKRKRPSTAPRKGKEPG